MRKPIVAFVAGVVVGAGVLACASSYWYGRQVREERAVRAALEAEREQTEAKRNEALEQERLRLTR